MAGNHAPVLIVGGPAGLVVAIELGRRGVPCIVFEQRLAPPAFPKANSTTSRTMAHYRRLGMGIRDLSARTAGRLHARYFLSYSF